MKAALLRVGIDTGCGGILGPIFADGTFEFIPIPEQANEKYPGRILNETRTYSSCIGTHGRPLIDYFPEGSNKTRHMNRLIHCDPEFETFTYGDPSKSKSTLASFDAGDYLIFYAGLVGADGRKSEPALYVIGYFEIKCAITVKAPDQRSSIVSDFGENFHVKHEALFNEQVTNPRNHGLKLVRGTGNSRLLKYAYKISEAVSSYKNARGPHNVLSIEAQTRFGHFDGRISIQRNSLRWIKSEPYVTNTVDWLKGLK